jgi:16S rRNA (uracil1498-N3)-methyltransferase
MRLTRVFVDVALEAGGIVELPKETAAHIAKVLRARSGDELVLFNGDGREFSGVIESVRGNRVAAAIGSPREVDMESPIAITLVQCVPRGEKMDLVVQKATELGVTRIVPVTSQRSVVRLDERQAHSKQTHWQAVAISACEQCGRTRLPNIHSPVPLLDYLGQLAPAEHHRWVLEPQTIAPALEHTPLEHTALGTAMQRAPLSTAQIAVGPEGGFAEDELEAFRITGFSQLRLGPRVLRTETAAIAAIVWLQTLFGDMS